MAQCCVLSGLDFKATSGSTVSYCLSNHLHRGHRVAVSVHGHSFVINCGSTQKSAHPPLRRTCKVLRLWPSFATLQYIYSCSLPSSSLFFISKVKKFGKPTWKRLVEAVEDDVGGNNCALARTIARDHPGEPGKHIH